MVMATVIDNVNLTRGWQHFLKGQVINIFKFVVNVVSIATTPAIVV